MTGIPSQTTNMHTLSETDKAYLAGLFDGEGCVGYYNASRTSILRPGYFHTSVHICNTYPQVIEWVAAVTGIGRVQSTFRNEKHRTAYQWQLGKKADVIVFLTAIRPYLIVKAAQVDVILSHHQLESSYVQRHGSVTPEIVKSRQITSDMMKLLKRIPFVEGVETGQAGSQVH